MQVFSSGKNYVALRHLACRADALVSVGERSSPEPAGKPAYSQDWLPHARL
jgi:hypothetical protein